MSDKRIEARLNRIAYEAHHRQAVMTNALNPARKHGRYASKFQIICNWILVILIVAFVLIAINTHAGQIQATINGIDHVINAVPNFFNMLSRIGLLQ